MLSMEFAQSSIYVYFNVFFRPNLHLSIGRCLRYINNSVVDQIIKQLMDETGARINAIVISGVKEAVAQCKDEIMKANEEKIILDLQLVWLY